MPLYTVEHSISLTASEQDAIAEAITQVHTTTFIVPRLFVNVDFIDVAKTDRYIGGRRAPSNRIMGHLRPGTRTHEQFNKLATDLTNAWDKAVNGGKPGKGDRELRNAVIMADVTAGREAGLTIPLAGQEKGWLKSNISNFKQWAAEGDVDYQLLLKEMEERDDLKSLLANGA